MLLDARYAARQQWKKRVFSLGMEKSVIVDLSKIRIPRVPKATKADMRDIRAQLAATANDPNLTISTRHWFPLGTLTLEEKVAISRFYDISIGG